jgi:murein tripeptide amidase MpaA
MFTESSPDTFTFELPPDTNSTDRQWFDFELAGMAGRAITFRLINTEKTNVPEHWDGARPVFSRDGGRTWQHVEGATSHVSNVYTFAHCFTADVERIAFHFPYPFEAALAKMDEWAAHRHVARRTLGHSVQGRPIGHLRITDLDVTARKRGVWMLARVHAAETTGSFGVEALIDFLLSDDPVAEPLRRAVDFHIVPFVNPDGAAANNYRNNAAGVNLNRVWDGSANLETSPEIVHVQGAINAWAAAGNPYDLFIDFHSTSGPYPHFAFHAHPQAAAPRYHAPTRYHADSRAFLALVAKHAPHFDPVEGASDSPDDNVRLSYHCQRIEHGVLSFTPEGIYSQLRCGPEPEAWATPHHHRQVGVAFARAIAQHFGLASQVAGSLCAG